MTLRTSLLFAFTIGLGACGRVEQNPSDDAAGGALTGGATSVAGAHTANGGAFITSDGGFSNGAKGGSMGGSGAVANGGAANGGVTSDGGKTSGGTTNGGDTGYAGEEGGDSIVALDDGSWETDASLKITSPATAGFDVSCPHTEFTMHLAPQGSGLGAVLGRDGYLSKGQFQRPTGAEPVYNLQGELGLPTKGECELTNLSITQLELAGYDSDIDGAADKISGYGKATGDYVFGDLAETFLFNVRLTGVRDIHKPSFVAATGLHPLDGISLATSEPVSTATTVGLFVGSARVPLAGVAADGAVTIFGSPWILPFGESFALTANGTDLAGLPFESNLAPITTLADPGLFAQDGFETSPKALLVGGATFVSSVGSLAALDGTQSLFVPPGGTATFHLARASGASIVRFTSQALLPAHNVSPGAPPVQAGVVGGIERLTPSSGPPASDIATGDAMWSYACVRQDVSIPLTESGPDVVVRVNVPDCYGFCPIGSAILLDDLRVE